MTGTFWGERPDESLRVGPGFRLEDVDPDSKPGTNANKAEGLAELASSAQELRELQEKLFAQSREGAPQRLLVVLQAMDAAGKGGVVNHVFGQLEPYGLELTAFKAPSEEEREHDFLWRIEPRVPGPGVIGLFDRSHYEDVLIQRVRGFAPPEEIERRYGAIAEFEKRIADEGVHIIKIMLHVSPEEQASRLLDRLDTPRSTGSTTRATLTNGCTGRATWRRFRSPSSVRTLSTRRGSSCRQTRSGTRGPRCSASSFRSFSALRQRGRP